MGNEYANRQSHYNYVSFTGEELARFRIRLGLTQRQVAYFSDFNPATISILERKQGDTGIMGYKIMRILTNIYNLGWRPNAS